MRRLCLGLLAVLLLAACGEAAPAVSVDGVASQARQDFLSDDRAPAPELVGTTLDGDEITIDGQGPVVVNFWASWCGPCVAEAPHLAAISREYADRGVRVVGINVDARVASARTFERDHEIPFPSLHDPSKQVAAAFGRSGPSGLPTTLILDSNLRVASRLLGSVAARDLAPRLDALLAESG